MTAAKLRRTDVRDEFLSGVCVALQVITSFAKSAAWIEAWAELVRTAGVDDILYYAAHVEPDEWELAGFSRYAKFALKRGKPRNR